MDNVNQHKNNNFFSEKFERYKFWVILFFILAFLSLAWYSYSNQFQEVQESQLPLIYFEKQIKFKPGNPGGLVFENTDKEIYDHISGKNTKYKKSNTIKTSEKPMSKNEAILLVRKQINEDRKVKTRPVKLYMPNNIVIDDSKKRSDTVIKYYILRIAKIKDASVFDKAWKIITNRHGGEIKTFKPKLYTEFHDGKKNYYIHVGPIKSINNAHKICNNLKSQGRKCTVLPYI